MLSQNEASCSYMNHHRSFLLQVLWLNKELKEVWPYVNKAASAVIKASVEPILAQYRPPLISSLLFTKLTLGTVAPQIAGEYLLPGKALIAAGGESLLEILT